MSALAQLGANGNSPKQKPTLSRHQIAIAATTGGDPYPANSSAVSLLALKIICTDSLIQSRTPKAPGERTAERRHKRNVGIGLFVREGSHLVKFGSPPLPLPVPLELNRKLGI
jgi:hypothetical protein